MWHYTSISSTAARHTRAAEIVDVQCTAILDDSGGFFLTNGV